VDLVFDDSAANQLPDSSQITSGTYRPTNFEGTDTYPAPAPAPPYGSNLAVFNGTSALGTWRLYVVDDVNTVDGGTINQWCLTIVTSGGTPPPTNTVVIPTNTSVVPTGTSVVPTITPPLPTGTAVATGTSAPTSTSAPATGTSVATSTSVVPTETAVPSTETAVATSTSVPATVTPCPLQFTDVPPNHTFYPNVRCLACRGILGGYADGTFRPNNDITRGQLSKIVSNSAGFVEPVSGQTFEDVNSTNTFYEYIERMASRGIIGGYPCGTVPGEPCGAGNLPYFRPNANATRGQISKIVSEAAGFSDPVTTETYEDVPSTATFYVWIERLTTRGVMGGYPCGTVPGEPCGAGNRPYFRPNNNATRGQVSKIVAGAFFPNCQTP
jgi:subtilisin-like proprotein convertase family protein